MAFAVLAALGHACFHPTALEYRRAGSAPAQNRGQITSYFVVGGNLGYAIGPVLAGALVWWLGLPGLLFLVIPAIIMVFVLKVLLPGGIAAAQQHTHAVPAAQPAACTVKMAVRDPDGRLRPPGMGGLCRNHLPADVSRVAGL